MMKPKIPKYCCSVYRTVSTVGHQSNPKLVNGAQSGRVNFEKDFAKSHIKTNLFQKVLLGLGSGVVSITSPSRGDMIAVMGEVTGYQAFEYIRSRMAETEEGRRILEDEPRISSGSLDLEKLKSYPEGTLGKAYSNFLGKYGYSPDSRNAVQFVDNRELAYVAQRYREAHDLIHTLLDMPTNMLGEVTVKWVEAIQFRLPMCATGALFGAVRLAPKFTRAYSTKSIIKLDSSLIEKLDSEVIHPRRHPGVMHLPRVVLPNDILATVKTILKEHDWKNLVKEAEEFKKQMHHRVLPIDAKEKDRLRKALYKQYKRQYTREELEENLKLEDQIEREVSQKFKSLVQQWKPIEYNRREGLKYAMARGPVDYAVLKRVLNEIKLRDKDFAPQSLFDFGSGIGTVNWAAHDLWGNTLKEYYCVDTSAHMHELAALILKRNSAEGEPFIRNVYYRQFFPATPRPFDIVVSSFSFFDLPNTEARHRMYTALWNNTTDYFVLIETGSNWGFRIITEARDYLLGVSKDHNIDCHVFAPCPHDLACPRLYAEGKKTPCNFFIQYKKFNFREKTDDTGLERFSFLILRKKPPPPLEERPCRVVRKIIRHSHLAVCKVCTTDGELIDLNVTPSKHGKHAYQCMKCSTWGDVLPGMLQPRMLEAPSSPLIASASDKEELISDSDSDSESGSDSESSSDSDCDESKSRNDNVDNKK